jgi:hypothetical protein
MENIETGLSTTAEQRKKGDDFYIGWMGQAPAGLGKFLRTYVVLILLAIAIIATTIVLSQKKFGTGTFEYGTLTQVQGAYFDKPVPVLKVIAGKDLLGTLSYITIPLVGYGKHGAEGIISEIEKERNISLDRKEVTFKGTLLYNDGKTILQIDGNDKPLLAVSNKTVAEALLPKQQDLGMQRIRGEIIDPKCYFGVMKPGEGKPHRDCAIRCILGGIPPVLAVKNEKGEANYYLIVGPHGEKINEQVQDYVAEPVELEAYAVQYDDWIVLYTKSKQAIHQIAGLELVRPGAKLLACGPACTLEQFCRESLRH